MSLSRRNLLAAGGAALATVATRQTVSHAEDVAKETAGDASSPAITKGRIHQSVMGWCFKPMPSIELAKHCKAIGIEAIEGIPASDYPAVTKLGLKISLVGSHGFQAGPLDPENHAMNEAKLREAIDTAVEFGAPSVITFTGMRKAGIDDRQATKNCLDLWKRVLPYAEANQITLVLEHLNSRDDTHPMKGHPGYWGDDVELCVDLVKQLDSPRFKLLFDIYHVQIMNGDIIRRIREYHPLIGHYHTAGAPGRGELNEDQEINYPAVMRAILETGYSQYVAQEFIPTSKDPIASLREAARVCDV
ncbi:Hydroxypyruvate isomerase [Rosistilla carotiformis]|uniref:Hydroxypyruvate isomerase n=1 Tax=Rosistilla carotiformis TaxID=2528017 RepID=A0A518K1T7_9BACT|nr:TIM barrel protein [Rosistilla carotiformis]QDV71729.1 Hydroxypyruvate isomerase [Rosistilla carotiformis]